ncbi:MAG: cytoplasmic protein [Desulfobacterales bacterium]|nr:MAG: cytoplasmic protein [Desulfobacterales bacterium]
MTEDKTHSADFTVDKQNLYREETFTDLKVASIRRLTPVRPDGSEDKGRRIIFVGQTSLLSPNGAVPIQNIIQAKDLQQAIKKFPEAMLVAVDRLIEEAKKVKRREESRIIIPGR